MLVCCAGKFLANSGFVKGNNILAGTNFFFSTNKKGLFTAEGRLPDQYMLLQPLGRDLHQTPLVVFFRHLEACNTQGVMCLA